jgi:hypothetical protein
VRNDVVELEARGKSFLKNVFVIVNNWLLLCHISLVVSLLVIILFGFDSSNIDFHLNILTARNNCYRLLVRLRNKIVNCRRCILCLSVELLLDEFRHKLRLSPLCLSTDYLLWLVLVVSFVGILI